MTGSYLFYYESYYNGLMTDLGLCSTKIQRKDEVTKTLGGFRRKKAESNEKRSAKLKKTDYLLGISQKKMQFCCRNTRGLRSMRRLLPNFYTENEHSF